MNVDDSERLAAVIVYAAEQMAEAVSVSAGAPLRDGVREEVKNKIVLRLLGEPFGPHSGIPADDGPGLFDDGAAVVDDGPSLFDEEPFMPHSGAFSLPGLTRLLDDPAYGEGFSKGYDAGIMALWLTLSIAFTRQPHPRSRDSWRLVERVGQEVERMTGQAVLGDNLRLPRDLNSEGFSR